jgi:hypothetical protein
LILIRHNYTLGLLAAAVALAGAACSTTPRENLNFSGTWLGNEAESMMLPGQHVPKNMVGVMEDDGHELRTAQIYMDSNGKEVRRFVWNSVCDGKASAVSGVNHAGAITLGCRRTGRGEFIMELKDRSGYSHVETCRLSADGRKHTCSGVATLPDGSKHDFVYVFDRK